MDLDKLLEEEEALNQAKEGLSVVKNVSNVCKYCKSSQIDQNFVKLFKLKVCFECKVRLLCFLYFLAIIL